MNAWTLESPVSRNEEASHRREAWSIALLFAKWPRGHHPARPFVYSAALHMRPPMALRRAITAGHQFTKIKRLALKRARKSLQQRRCCRQHPASEPKLTTVAQIRQAPD